MNDMNLIMFLLQKMIYNFKTCVCMTETDLAILIYVKTCRYFKNMTTKKNTTNL